MSRLPGLNALLFLVVAALGAFAYLRPGSETPAEQAISNLQPSDVHSIRIERRGAADIALDKRAGGWVVTAPLAVRADELRVQRLLEIVKAKASHKMAAAGLERFELAQSAARVTMDGQAFSFGMVNAVTREQYLMSRDAIYTVNPNYGTALPADPIDMASRQLLGSTEIPQRIALKEFTVEQRDGRWTVTPAPAGELSQDDLVRWVDGWRLASAIHVEPYAGGNPQSDITIQLKNGNRVILGMLSRGANLVLTRPDEKLQYHFRIDSAKRMLSLPAGK